MTHLEADLLLNSCISLGEGQDLLFHAIIIKKNITLKIFQIWVTMESTKGMFDIRAEHYKCDHTHQILPMYPGRPLSHSKPRGAELYLLVGRGSTVPDWADCKRDFLLSSRYLSALT